MTPIESLPAKWPDRIVLWSRGVSPHWYFVAAKSERPDIKGSPVYETLDPIVLKGSPEALAAQPKEGELLALIAELDDWLQQCPNPEKVWPRWLIKNPSRLLWKCRATLRTLASRRVVDEMVERGLRALEKRWGWKPQNDGTREEVRAILEAALQPDSGEG